MKKKDNSKNIIIALLAIIIIILATLVVLFATNTISFNTSKETNNTTDSTNQNNQAEDSKQNETLLTNYEAELILKNIYNDTVRDIFNQGLSYCGETDGSINLDGFTYAKSVTFKTFEELDNHVKKYLTESLLSTTGYNNSTTINEKTINSYIERDGNLYCNTNGKGGNVQLAYYSDWETNFEIVKIEENSFDATINAVYYGAAPGGPDKEKRTTLKINTTIIKQNDNWLMNTYEEQEI